MTKERKFIRRCSFCGKLCWDIKIGATHNRCLLKAYKEEGYDLEKPTERLRFERDHIIEVHLPSEADKDGNIFNVNVK